LRLSCAEILSEGKLPFNLLAKEPMTATFYKILNSNATIYNNYVMIYSIKC